MTGEQPRSAGVVTVHETDRFRIRGCFTDRSAGDFTPGRSDSELLQRRRSIAPGEWSWLNQVHGAVVHVVAGQPICGADGDGLVTTTEGSPLSVRTADCAPVLLWSPGAQASPGPDSRESASPVAASPVLGAVHAGWKGLAAGVVQRCVAEMRAMGAGDIDWMVGPCISAAEYEFGSDDLALMVTQFGPQVRSQTRWGTPALDLRAAVASACAEAGLGEPWGGLGGTPPCTATDDAYFSHRARSDSGRQVGVIWWERHV